MAKTYKNWSQDEIDWFINNYPYSDLYYMSEYLEMSIDSIRHLASKLGLKRKKNGTFTAEEDELIARYWPDMPEDEFVEKYMPHRTVRGIQVRASKLGVVRRNKWTDLEDEFLVQNYTKYTIQELSDMIKTHSRESVYNRLKKLGLTSAGTFKYSANDIEYIRSNYLSMTDGEIGVLLNRSEIGIKIMREKLGLYRLDPTSDNKYISILKFIQANNTLWKKESMERCGFKCVISGDVFDDIHHVYAKNMILSDIIEQYNLEEDFDINTCDESLRQELLRGFLNEQAKHPLGLCLSKDLHKLFHIKYGFGNNTPEQFIEFVNDVAPDKVDYIRELIA